MAGLFAILNALARASWRDLRALRSVSANNFVFVALLFPQIAGTVFAALILGFLLLAPSASAPLSKIPADRLALWPLSPRERVALEITSLGLSPIAWIAAALIASTGRPLLGLEFVIAAAGVNLLATLAAKLKSRTAELGLPGRLPRLPSRLGSLVQKDMRQLLSLLDTYVALVVSIAACVYRFASRTPDAEAYPILALVAALSMSTSAQCLFGLDRAPGLTRYGLLPLRGWEILLAKDIALLLILTALTLPLAPLPAVTAGLVALGIGHYTAVMKPVPQTRWAVTGGVLLPIGFLQCLFMTAAGVAAYRQSAWYFAASVAFCAASVFLNGRLWDRGK